MIISMKRTHLISRVIMVSSLMAVSLMAFSQAPVITGFTPKSGKPGTVVTITGSQFDTTPANNNVFFGSVKAAVTTASTTSLSVIVPPNTMMAALIIQNNTNGLQAMSSAIFIPTFDGEGIVTNGTFPQTSNGIISFNSVGLANDMIVSDMNNDGKPEIITSNCDAGGYGLGLFMNSSVTGIITATTFDPVIKLTIAGCPAGGTLGVADLDGDGLKDIVIGFSGFFGIYKNIYGGGAMTAASFAPVVSISATGLIVSTSVGDIDGDGKPEIILGKSNGLSVYQNLSTGQTISTSSFALPVNLTNSGGYSSVILNDINNDGKNDLITISASSTPSIVSVLKNIHSGTTITNGSFAAKIDFTIGNNASKIILGDIDNDDKAEIIAGYNATTGFVSVLKNNISGNNITAGSFATPVNYTTGTTTNGPVKVTDLDGDGKPDIVCSSYTQGVTVFKNTSTDGVIDASTLANGIPFLMEGFHSLLDAGDVDGDGKPEILAGSNQTSAVNISHNLTGPPVFPSAPAITTITPMKGSVGSEVIISGTNFNPLMANNVIYFGSIKATITSATTTTIKAIIPAGTGFESIKVLDLASGLCGYSPDAFSITYSNGKNIVTAAADGAKTGTSFLKKVRYASGVTGTNDGSGPESSLVIADLDDDGKADIIKSNAGTKTISIFKNTSTPGTIDATTLTAPFSITLPNVPTIVAAGDLDGDGKPEILVAYDNIPSGSYIAVYKNFTSPGTLNSSSFTPVIEFPVTYRTVSIQVRDIDFDGRPDILAGVSYFGLLTIFRNISIKNQLDQNSFSARQDFATSNEHHTVITGDVDRDKNPDIAMVGDDYSASVFRNTSVDHLQGITLDAPIRFLTSGSPVANPYGRDILLTDFDGDGFNDMISSTGNGNYLFFWRNTASPGSITPSSFSARYDFLRSNGNVANSMVAGDLNGDGKTDIVLGNSNYSISFFENKATPGVLDSTTFRKGRDLAIGPNPIPRLSLSDIDGDGQLDIIGTIFGKDSLFILHNFNTNIVLQNTSACAGSIAAFSIKQNNNLTYQWQKLNTTTSLYEDVSNTLGYSGAATSTLTIDTNGNFGAGSYHCKISGVAGGAIFTTDATLTITAGMAGPVTTNQSFCKIPSSVVLSASGGSNGQYKWYTSSTGASAISGEINDTYTTPSINTTTTYYVSINNGACESPRTPVTATLTSCDHSPAIAPGSLQATVGGTAQLPLSSLLSDPDNDIDLSQLRIIVQPASGASASIDGQENLIVDYQGISFSGRDSLTLQVCDQSSLCAQQKIYIDVEDDIIIYTGISPNGNGQNDVWHIKNIEILSQTKNNHVTIYNRWGDEVYDASDYDNNQTIFKGLNKQGNELPVGIYFYKITFQSGRATSTGYLSLKR